MRRVILCILALALLLPSLAQAYDVLVLQSRRNPAYDEVLKGFNSGQSVSQRLIVLSDYAEVDLVRIVREDRPRVILTVGDAAVVAARKIRDIPVIALMTLGVHGQKTVQPNLTGIGMFVAPERYCDLLRRMQVKRVGVIYNPVKSGWYLQHVKRAVQNAGITLIAREVSTPPDTLAQLTSLVGKVDALWMLPDLTAVTRDTTEAYFHFSQQQEVPVVSFAAGYLGLGAAAVIEIDRVSMGRQARDMVAAILADDRADSNGFSFPKAVLIKTNPVVLNRLGRPQF